MPKANDLRRIRRFRQGLSASLALLLASVVLYYFAPLPSRIREFIVLAGVAVYALSALLVVFSRCPRCGRLFHNVLGFNNPLSRFCSHCGLSLDGDDRVDNGAR